ncbi:MAG: NERD domain-containing protein [Chloroflexi bacterium]|nr:NERD domain-containing protein [Chloroflexota bacterium]
MVTYTDHQAIAQKTKVAKYASLGGLALMLPGLFIALGGLANPTLTTGEFIAISYVSLIAGTIVATLGGRLAEQWLIEPRNDQRLEKVMKGLDKRYRLINYHTPADHVLLTPTGLYVLVVKDETGLITFDGKHWRQPFSLGRVWHDWRHGGLGNPTAEADAQIARLQKWLKPNGVGADAPVKPMIVFTKPEVELNVPERSEHIMPLKSLKGYLQRHTTPALSSAVYRALADAVTPQGGTVTVQDDEGTPEPASAPMSKKDKRRKKQKEIS